MNAALGVMLVLGVPRRAHGAGRAGRWSCSPGPARGARALRRHARPRTGNLDVRRRLRRACACTGGAASGCGAAARVHRLLGARRAALLQAAPRCWPLAFVTFYLLVLLGIYQARPLDARHRRARPRPLRSAARGEAASCSPRGRADAAARARAAARQPRRRRRRADAVPHAHRRLLVPRGRPLRAARRPRGDALMASISFEHVTKRFDETVAVDDLEHRRRGRGVPRARRAVGMRQDDRAAHARRARGDHATAGS